MITVNHHSGAERFWPIFPATLTVVLGADIVETIGNILCVGNDVDVETISLGADNAFIIGLPDELVTVIFDCANFNASHSL